MGGGGVGGGGGGGGGGVSDDGMRNGDQRKQKQACQCMSLIPSALEAFVERIHFFDTALTVMNGIHEGPFLAQPHTSQCRSVQQPCS